MYGFTVVLPVPTDACPPPPQPVTPAITPRASTTISRPPSLRLCGMNSRKIPATATPEPAAYHSRPAGLDLPGNAGSRRLAVMPDRLTVVVCELEELPLNVNVAGLNATVGVNPDVDTTDALNVTVPANPFTGAIVRVTGGTVPPAATFTVALVPLARIVAVPVLLPLAATE